jgi:uncharacterized lipoprotein YbaY
MSDLINNPLKCLRFAFLLLGVLFISACSMMNEVEEVDSTAEMKTLKGEVTFRERIVASKNVTLRVILFNSSKEKGRRDVVASMHKMISHSQPPYPFELEYDVAKLKDNKTYMVEARLEVNGKVRMLPAQPLNPFAEGVDAQNLVIEVQGVGLTAAKQAIKAEEAPVSAPEEAVTE